MEFLCLFPLYLSWVTKWLISQILSLSLAHSCSAFPTLSPYSFLCDNTAGFWCDPCLYSPSITSSPQPTSSTAHDNSQRASSAVPNPLHLRHTTTHSAQAKFMRAATCVSAGPLTIVYERLCYNYWCKAATTLTWVQLFTDVGARQKHIDNNFSDAKVASSWSLSRVIFIIGILFVNRSQCCLSHSLFSCIDVRWQWLQDWCYI